MMNFTLTMFMVAVLLSGCSSVDKQTAEGIEGKEVTTAIPKAEKTEQVQNVSYIQSFVDNSNGWKVQIGGQSRTTWEIVNLGSITAPNGQRNPNTSSAKYHSIS